MYLPDSLYHGIILSTNDGTIDGEIIGYVVGNRLTPNDDLADDNTLGYADGPLFGLPVGILDGVYDGIILGTDDGVLTDKALRAPTGINLGVTNGLTEDNALGNGDRSVLGLLFSIEGGVYNYMLGCLRWC